MKKIIAIVAALALTSVAASAQNGFGAGDMRAKLGYAVVGGYSTGGSTSGNGYTHINPISLSVDYGVMSIAPKTTFGLGVFLSGEYVHIKGSTVLGITIPSSTAVSGVAAIRPFVNYSLLSNIDVYGGLYLGYEFPLSKNGGDGEFVWAPYVGLDFYFLGNFGVFANFGYGSIAKDFYGSGLNTHVGNAIFLELGLTYKF